VQALTQALTRGTAWPGASDAQIEFAELLCARIGADAVRFANTGTEATMLGVKLARSVTGRPVIIKGWHAYHGSYDDLEAGLQGQAEVPGRVALARFGDLASYAAALERNAGQVAAIIVEPVQYTGLVTTPPPGFLPALRDLARDAGVLFVLDDCLMFRLAEGGSAQRFGIDADITCLGKWIGGGLPVGAVLASSELMSVFDPLGERPSVRWLVQQPARSRSRAGSRRRPDPGQAVDAARRPHAPRSKRQRTTPGASGIDSSVQALRARRPRRRGRPAASSRRLGVYYGRRRVRPDGDGRALTER
jgi:glutamate-1-semialdehyde aminotransferase